MIVAANILLLFYVALAVAYWLWQAVSLRRVRCRVPALGSLPLVEPKRWPRLSVIVPACNEADRLEPAARSLLASDYPDLEILFVDDRSADGTGAIIDRLAAEDARVRALHVAQLPDGWLGKVNALQTGLAASTGDLVLFTDADIHFAPDALRRAVAYLLAGKFDHVPALPRVDPASPLVDVVVAGFLRQFLSATRAWAVSDPQSRAYLGIGAFNLVRRDAFESTEGFAWLRMETGDDMGVGLLMKRAGKRSGPVVAASLVHVQWLRTFTEAVRSSEKGYAAVCRFSFIRSLLLATLSVMTELSPLLTLVPLAWPETRAAGAAGLAVAAACGLAMLESRFWYRGRLWVQLVSPLVAPINAVVILRTAILGKLRGGATWRGTVYREADLRAGLRIRFP
jgi:cellulose synthase/poly-beta-1,6-N-acetylglucosamine synthase-like glycosyltransferase